MLDNILFSINAVLPLFLLMALGFIFKKVKLGNDAFFSASNKISFKVLLPVMLFINIYDAAGTEIFDWRFVALPAVCVLVLTAILCVLVPVLVKDRKKIGAIIQAIFRSNYLLFGTPLVRNMFGEEALWVTSILMPVIIPLFNILAVFVLTIYISEKRGKQVYLDTLIKIFKNPLIIGAVLGFVVSALEIQVPKVLYSTMDTLSSLATPLALIALGGSLQLSSMKTNLKYIIPAAAGKLMLVGMVMIPIAVAMGYRGSHIGALLALSSSPTAVSSYVMAEQSGNDGVLAGQLVAITTMASVITMFFWILILRSLGVL